MRTAVGVCALLAWCCSTAALELQPNPPLWPDSVQIFDSDDQRNIASVIGGLFKDEQSPLTMEEVTKSRVESHFSSKRIALMFKRGRYRQLSIPTTYYTQVLGLGETVDDVSFTDLREHNGPWIGSMSPGEPDPGSLDTFWRAAENMMISGNMLWAVSQAAPLRRIHVTGDLEVSDDRGYASGGFMASSKVDGTMNFGGQQQWLNRNNHIEKMFADPKAGYSKVFVGCSGNVPKTTANDSSSCAISTVETTPVIAEKPFITHKDGSGEGKFFLQVPPIQTDVTGFDATQTPSEAGMRSVPFEEVFLADANKHGAAEIQKHLSEGFHVVLAPGIFNLTQTLVLSHDQQVLLGIGMATLTAPTDGSPCIKVQGGKRGVRVAGVMLQASRLSNSKGSVLLQWGDPEDAANYSQSHTAVAGVLSDIFARVGGPDLDRQVGVETIMKIYENQVIGDNLWLWRADHAKLPASGPDNDPKIHTNDNKEKDYHLTVKNEYPCTTGLDVHGVNVTMYGLFVEHTTGALTNWYGDGGRVYFYQSELPYDVEESTIGYNVGPKVGHHEGYGIGVYSFYRDYAVIAKSGLVLRPYEGIKIVNAFTVHLDGKGGIEHVINEQGGMAESHKRVNLPTFQGTDAICPDSPACPTSDKPACQGPACSPDSWSKPGLIVAAGGVVVLVTCLASAVMRVLSGRRAEEPAETAPVQVDMFMKLYATLYAQFAKKKVPPPESPQAEMLMP